MAVEKGINPFSFPAYGDLSSYQYYCVNFNSTSGRIYRQTTVGGTVCGILQNDPAAAARAAVVQTLAGTVTKVSAGATKAGESISIGDALQASTAGFAQKNTTGGTAYIIGRALAAVSTSSVAGSRTIIPMFLTHEGRTSTA